jgi:hypothetical protein
LRAFVLTILVYRLVLQTVLMLANVQFLAL